MAYRLASAAWLTMIFLGLLSMTFLGAGLARHRPQWLLGAFSIVILLTPRSGEFSLGHVGGRQVLGEDPVLVVALVGAFLGLSRLAERLGSLRHRAGFLALLVAFHLVAGYVIYANDAILSARSFVLIVALVAFLLSLDEDKDVEALVRSWLLWTSGALSLLALERAVTGGIGNANTQVLTAAGESVTTRVEIASQIAIVAAAALLSLYETLLKPRPATVVRTAAFILVVLIGQHRSVWFAAAAGLAVLLIRSVRPLQVARGLGALAFIAVLLSPVIVYSGIGSKIGVALSDSVSTLSTTTGTGGGRVSGNGQLIAHAREKGTVTVLFGSHYGAPVERIENGRLVTYQAHDAYVQTFLDVGLVGLATILALLLPLLSRAWRHRGGWLAVGVLFMVYSVAYAFPPQLAPVLAALCVLGPLGSIERSSAATTVPARAGSRRIPVA